MYGYIYRITDLTNGKCYIGQHKYDKPMLDPKYHGSSSILKNQIKKHPKNFLEEIIFIAATLDELNYFETYFIEHMNTLYPNGYNLNTGGDHYQVSDETKVKMRKKHKPFSADTKLKMSQSKKGKKLPPRNKEWSDRIGKSNKGKHHTEETKKQISETLKGRVCSEETCQNMTTYHISKEQLYNLYIKDNLTISFIADLLGCSSECIRRKLKKYGISKK